MNNFLLLFVLCLLIIRSKCGPEIFKFTSQPVSQTVNSGGTVTLSCVATGRTGITYSWYQLGKHFSTPPSEATDLISGATGTEYEVDAADDDDSGEDKLFQCKATAGNDVILSNVATVKYTLTDNIEYNSNGQSYLDQVVTTPDDEGEAGVYIFRIQCNANEDDFDNSITNGEPYDVQWFKGGESGRVEDNHDNMWTYYNPTKFSDYKIEFAGDYEVTLSTVDRYDLVIVSVRTTDEGKYSCKAVSRVNKQEVLLGSTVLKVPLERDYPVKPFDIITGYMVLSVDDFGKLKSNPNVGDKVLLMCGAACRTSSGSYNAQYQWKDSTNKVIANTREHIVTVDSVGSATFTCEILDSECNSDVSSEDFTFTSPGEINPMLQFTFSKSPPEYMWYDISDDTKSHTPFEIGCEGSLSSGNTVFFNEVYKMPDQLTGSSATEVYDFGQSITSDKSGVYQCGMYNNPNKVLWYQKTTNVVIPALPSAGFTPTTVSVPGDTTATFTCTVGGYPIESVTISGPNSLSFDCLTSSSSGDVTCSSTDNINYLVNVNNFKLEYAGGYKCTVETKWYKSASASAIVNSASDDVTLSYESTTELTVSQNPADKGSSVTLTCVVKGDPEPGEPELTKTVDSSASTIAMTCSGTTTKTCKKVFSAASYTDSGLYTCNGKNVINTVEKLSSDFDTLEIVGNADATLTQAPVESELLKGSSVNFTCKVEGNPLPTKLIFKKGTQIIKSYPSGSDTDVYKDTYQLSYEYSINSLKLTDTSDYKCEGENNNGGIRPDIDIKTLTVVSDVTVSLSASTDKPSFGDAFTITCTATGGRKPHSVTLTHEGTAISTGAFPCIDDGDYSKKCTYTHTVNDYSAGGTYTCTGLNKVAGNTVRTDSKFVEISVSKTVVVSLTPASETEITYGSPYTITCKVEGGDKPHKVTLNIPDSSTDLNWQRGSSGNSLTCTGEYSLVCKYGMSSSVYSNEGQYSCTGYNKLPGDNNEKSNSATGSLVVVKNVELQLTDTITSNSNEVYYGDDFKITCVAEGGRIPFYLELIQTPLGSSTPKELVLYDTTASKTPDSVTVDDGGNTLTYVSNVINSGYDDIGTYKCSSKNEVAAKAEQDAEDEVDIVVVRNVTSTISNFDIVDKGSQLKITCTAEGYRPPHNIALEKDGKSVIDWNNLTSSTECTTLAFYKFECVHSVTDVGYTNGGSYTCISKNYALGSKEVIGEDDKTLQISQTVLTQLDPQSERELELGGSSLSITCNIEGGNQPHKASMKLPDGSILIWNRDTSRGVQNTITCTGDNEIECVHVVTSTTFDNTGDYNCTGYNKIPADSTTVHTESKTVRVVIVRAVTAAITSSAAGSDEVDFGTELKLTCKVEGGRTPFFLSVYFTNRANITSKIIQHDKTDQSDQIIRSKSSLEYVHTISNITYDSNGSYKCTGKNNALGNQERTDESSKSAVVVRDVRIDQKDNITVDFGTSLVFNFQLNGGRSPHLVKLDSENSNIFNWEDDSNVCTGTNTLTCTKTIGETDVNWTYDGTFTVTAENRARNNGVKTDTMEFSVTVYKDVVATITPSSEENVTYHEDKIITCKVEGGLSPHQVDLILPNLVGTKTWKKDGSMKSLQCSGEHELTCMHTFTPEYDSDGDYKCKGYNEGSSGQKESESEVKLTTVRQTQVNVSKETISVLTNGVIEVDCVIVGKPLVDISSVTWTHSLELDLSDFVTTVKGNQDGFTLNSMLTMTNPLTNYTGIFYCNVADHDGEIISKATNVFINNREFLEPPNVSYNDAEFIEKGSQIFITCLVQGFPAPSASLTYEGQDSILETTEPQSITSTKFVFSVTTTCEYLNLNFSCNAKTTTSSEVLKKSAQIVGPIITGCENPLPVILGGGIGGGVFFIIIIAIVVFFIARRIRGRQDRSYTPKNGAEFPNPTFTPDPTYATVGDNQVGGPGGYSHLNRPVGETDEEGYASIGQLKPGTVLASGEDAYATLDSTSNGMLGLKRQGSNETYAALDRPAPGKAKRGVIRKYKPISNKPKTFGMPPNKPATEDIEMGETSHGGQPDPTYATVNPATLKTKAKASDYADVTLPDLPPEVPIYGQSSHRQRPIPSEYADATLPPPPPQTPYNMADKQQPILSEYADVTLPGPPEVLYSNMADRQNDTLAEDPVYAQIDLKNRTMPQRRVEEEEDLPPDVPVYGTMGELTEPYSPDLEDEDPYATVEFVPKSKRKPPRPKPKENANEGVYATITDIKENV